MRVSELGSMGPEWTRISTEKVPLGVSAEPRTLSLSRDSSSPISKSRNRTPSSLSFSMSSMLRNSLQSMTCRND